MLFISRAPFSLVDFTSVNFPSSRFLCIGRAAEDDDNDDDEYDNKFSDMVCL